MKLENCDWVPSHVVHWLSKKLEEKGIPAESYSNTLLSCLHPYFCPYPVKKDARPKSCLEKDIPRFEDFDDSVDSDADFPQYNKNKLITKKVDKNKSRKEEYHRKVVECLSLASNNIEELDQLVEELFDILCRALIERRPSYSRNELSTSNPASFNNFGRIEFPSTGRSLGSAAIEIPLSQLVNTAPDLPRALTDNINNGRLTCFNRTVSGPPKKGSILMNCERLMCDNMFGGGEPVSGSFSGGVGTPSSMKEEWEHLAQLVNAQNGTPLQSTGSRLFERAGGMNDPFHHSPGLDLTRLENKMAKEPWEDSFSLWKNDNAINDNQTESLIGAFAEPINEYGGDFVNKLGDFDEQIFSDPMAPSQIWEEEPFSKPQNVIGSHGPPRSNEGNDNESPKVPNKSLMELNSPFLVDGSFSNNECVKQKRVEDELCKSFRQVGIDIWKDQQQDFFPSASEPSQQLRFHATQPENCFKMPVKDVRLGGCDPFPKIPRGPAGPYAELNHTETSGFSSVIPQREIRLARNAGRVDGFGMADSHLFNPLEENENLLTSPRTHFKPIKQDSQGSSEEEKDELQVVSEAQTSFQNPEFLFQRSSSGNLMLENDFAEGSPRKYMVYKDPQSKVVGVDSPDVVEAASTSKLDATAVSFAPKFKISNNEKFSQTEPSAGLICSTQEFPPLNQDIFRSCRQKNTDFIWESNFQENIKKIWSKEDKGNGREVWEIGLENMSLEFSDSDQHWSKEEGRDPPEGSIPVRNFFKKRDLEGSDVLSRIKFLWPKASKNLPDSPTETEDRSNQDSFLDSSWSNSYLRKEGNGKTRPYGSISWNTGENEIEGDCSLSASDLPMVEKWKQWSFLDSDEMNLAPGDPPVANQLFDKSGDNDGAKEDLEILEPDWDLNDGFEWDPAMVDENQMNADSNERELFYCEVDGQQVMLPVEYLENELYDKYFGSAESKLSGSLPDLPYTETGDGKKIPFKIKRKAARAAHSNRPCTFYLEGNCLRTDCKFTHDLSGITCRFWEENACFKAETCPFLHGYPTHRKRNRSEGDQTCSDAVILAKLKGSKGRPIKCSQPPPSSFEIDSEADFPSLGSSFESRANSLEEISKIAINKTTGKKIKYVAAPNTLIKQLEVKCANVKSGSQRRKKTKSSNARIRSQTSSEKQLGSEDTTTRFMSEIHSPKLRFHDDGTVSDF